MADLPFGLQKPEIEKPQEVLIGFCECGAIRVTSEGLSSRDDWNEHVAHGQVWGRYELGEWRMLGTPDTHSTSDGVREAAKEWRCRGSITKAHFDLTHDHLVLEVDAVRPVDSPLAIKTYTPVEILIRPTSPATLDPSNGEDA